MNKTAPLLALFTFLSLVASCSTSQPVSNENESQSASIENSNASTIPTVDINEPVINIPSTNETAPAGILEQINWAPSGGGDTTVTPTPNPGCVQECSVNIKDSHIFLTNFNPNQKVRIVFYTRSDQTMTCMMFLIEYVTNSIVQVDESGNFSAKLSDTNKPLSVVVLDYNTNEKIWGFEYQYTPCDISYYNACSGAPKQRLKIDEKAYVCTQKDSVKLRSDAGKEYSEIKALIPGAEVTVIDGPLCADNWSWWQVRTESGFIGWMSEGGDEVDEYFLCPLP
ncbi:MAG TPA: SH3 domain-containing protein [Anaerolineales bacterium]|nr:SH3 domain-containing protein [Anaerolineales bacterium]HNM37490.1 SH3 domain-containing protein [Anaerolineales bacterium]